MIPPTPRWHLIPYHTILLYIYLSIVIDALAVNCIYIQVSVDSKAFKIFVLFC